MIVSVFVDAVEHEEVSLVLLCHATVRHRSSGFNLVDESLFIKVYCRVVALHVASPRVVVEVSDKCRRHVHVRGSSSRRSVVAMQGHSYVIHQFCNLCLLLVGSRYSSVCRQHQIPVVCGVNVCRDVLCQGVGGI